MDIDDDTDLIPPEVFQTAKEITLSSPQVRLEVIVKARQGCLTISHPGYIEGRKHGHSDDVLFALPLGVWRMGCLLGPLEIIIISNLNLMAQAELLSATQDAFDYQVA